MDLYFWFHDGIRKHLPPGLRRAIRRRRAWFMSVYGKWRIRRSVTRILGPQFRRSRDRLELDLTYACNLHCFNCNRSCEQAKDNGHMSVGQIRHFLAESHERQQMWRMIRVIGGEPTIHPQFLEIIDLLVAYKKSYSPGTRIVVCTNGHGERVQLKLSLLPTEVIIENTSKQSHVQPDFLAFNVAPVDSKEFTQADYTNGCSIIKKCGFGLSPSGYYPCGPAGGIDRVFGFNLGRKSLPSPDDDMQRELRRFCAVCGIFRRTPEPKPLLEPVMSQTWSRAYARWVAKRPVLTPFPERPSSSESKSAQRTAQRKL